MSQGFVPGRRAALVVAGVLAVSSLLLLVEPARPAVAEKTYDIWVSRGGDAPPHVPFHDCAKFTTSTIQLALCGADGIGPLTETALIDDPPGLLTQWTGSVPCDGLNLFFVGVAVDGATVGFSANVLGSSLIGLAQGATFGVSGVANDACTLDLQTTPLDDEAGNPYAAPSAAPRGE